MTGDLVEEFWVWRRALAVERAQYERRWGWLVEDLPAVFDAALWEVCVAGVSDLGCAIREVNNACRRAAYAQARFQAPMMVAAGQPLVRELHRSSGDRVRTVVSDACPPPLRFDDLVVDQVVAAATVEMLFPAGVPVELWAWVDGRDRMGADALAAARRARRAARGRVRRRRVAGELVGCDVA